MIYECVLSSDEQIDESLPQVTLNLSQNILMALLLQLHNWWVVLIDQPKKGIETAHVYHVSNMRARHRLISLLQATFTS